MPFLFRVIQNDRFSGDGETLYYLVVIASEDYTFYDSRWMSDSDLPYPQVLVPTVDLSHEQHKFTGMNAELLAKQFIKNWWMTHKAS